MARSALLDDPYYDAILRVDRALRDRGLPVCLVGGGASQVWLASLLTSNGARRLSSEVSLPTLLRPTRDADFSTRSDPATALSILNELAAGASGPADVLGPRTMRLGPVQISLILDPGDLAGMASLYDELLASRNGVVIRRGRAPDTVSVIGLDALVATKLTRRGDEAKDLIDVTNLLAASRVARRAVDPDAVRRYLVGDPGAVRLLSELFGEMEGA